MAAARAEISATWLLLLGPRGRVYAIDYSEAMLRRAKKLCDQRGWHNVTLLQENAAQFTLSEMVDGVLFSLSYSVIPNSRAALAQAWKYLGFGKRLVNLFTVRKKLLAAATA